MASKEIEILDPAASVEKLKKIAADRALNRRRFLTALGMTGAVAGAGLLSGCSVASNPATVNTIGAAQSDILNFVLNLKFLEATFYSYITTGNDLPASVTVNGGAVTGAPAKLAVTAQITQQTIDLLNEIYFDELNHVTTLRSILGSSVVFRPAINLAAFGAINSTVGSASNALSIARVMEDVGVTALASAATGLTTSSVTFVAQILGVESFHAGALRLNNIQLNTVGGTALLYDQADSLDVAPYDPGVAATAAAGPGVTGGFFPTYGAAALGATAGFAYARTSSQVLAILYGARGVPAISGTASGGFFPNGVNGNIKTV
jgi:hypothetical protein